MLKIVDTYRKLNMGQLLKIYEEEIKNNRKSNYPDWDSNLGMIEAEQDFYAFCRQFLSESNQFIYLWLEEDRHVSALRIEPYRDGVLLTGLETAPAYRRMGYGRKLLQETIDLLKEKQVRKVYSHIRLDNIPSVHLHTQCGFIKLRNSAVMLDGSANHRTGTFCLEL